MKRIKTSISQIIPILLISLSLQSFTGQSVFARDCNIPKLNPDISPLDPNNQKQLYERLVKSFDTKYEKHLNKNPHKKLADGHKIYFFRRELQALIDMTRATGDLSYLNKAKSLTFKAIKQAKENPKPLILHGQKRGTYPCFYAENIKKQTGGHGQLYDFQGSVGFLMVANALKQYEQDGWEEIASFVEKNIIEKWLYRYFIEQENLEGEYWRRYLLIVLDGARDKREHFARICLDMNNLGFDEYPYRKWGEFLVELYLGERKDLSQKSPYNNILGKHAPEDWGVIPQDNNTLVWYWTKDIIIQDTSHANRTVWLACKAYSNGLIKEQIIQGFINTFKKQIWDTSKGAFYFNNYINGSDKSVRRLGPGRKGNVWFGWNRLAAYDEQLRELFISLGYDLTNDGPNITPDNAQNKAMENAPLCLIAWAGRLIADNGKPEVFP